MQSPSHILITGASGGLGAALAEVYAGAGVTLTLLGRDTSRLQRVANACRENGAIVQTFLCDVTDSAQMRTNLIAIDAATPIDLVIANAGISAGTSKAAETEDQTRAIFATNVEGTLNTLLPLLPLFRARRRGQIALISSLASFRGLPGAPAYCASKGAIRLWGEALRHDLESCGIKLSVVCPGFIKTPMTDANGFHMPLMMSAGRAAQLIQRGLTANKPRIAFPLRLALAAQIFAALPPALSGFILGKLPRK